MAQNSFLSNLSYISPLAGLFSQSDNSGSNQNPLNVQRLQRFTPQGESSLQQLLSMGQQNLQNPLQGFDALKTRANQRFSQETVPALLERFSASGDNALSSPSLKSELSQASGTLQERLAGLESQYRQGRESLGLQQMQLGLTPQFENILRGEDEGIFPGIAGGLSQGLASAIPLLLKLLMAAA